MDTDDAMYRRSYDLAREAIDEQDAGQHGSDPAAAMRDLVAEAEGGSADPAASRQAIEDGVRDAVRGGPPRP